MFDFENPFAQAAQITDDPVETDWENAEWEHVVNSPEHRAEGDQRSTDREELLANFHERSEQRRKERTQISACRYGLIALACGLLAYAFSYYGINWLAHTIGIVAVSFAITSSYGFGRVREIG